MGVDDQLVGQKLEPEAKRRAKYNILEQGKLSVGRTKPSTDQPTTSKAHKQRSEQRNDTQKHKRQRSVQQIVVVVDIIVVFVSKPDEYSAVDGDQRHDEHQTIPHPERQTVRGDQGQRRERLRVGRAAGEKDRMAG